MYRQTALFASFAILVANLMVVVTAGSPPGQNAASAGEQAGAFVADAEARLLDLWTRGARADWVANTHITEDTELLSAQASDAIIEATMDLARKATRFDNLKLHEDVARKLKLLKLSLTMPAPLDARARKELTEIAASLTSDYGKGKYCPDGRNGKCLDLGELEDIMATSRDPRQLLDAWRGWRTISPQMRQRYQRFVELSNAGSRELGYADTGVMWRSKYDMTPDAFTAELERMWQQVRPLYESLHAYVRSRLVAKHGKEVVRPDGPIPAHLLGNMWAQSWINIYDLVKPAQDVAGFDLTALIKARSIDEQEMVRYGERFFMSLGMAPLPDTFWTRSLFRKPADREVVCHASAWDIDYADDVRLKMCIKLTGEDFATIHHELGHNFYQRAYKTQPSLFRDSANDGFHEALGDTLALSITPKYLVRIGLLPQEPSASGDIGLLLKQALDKVAFLPFGLMVDRWRWQVFAGDIDPTRYNQAWWDLTLKYQGVAPPVARSEANFDPGAKYHIPANTPYTRYFLATILQFQFHRALCEAAGETGPLHRCTIHDSKAAGNRLVKMMEMGQSRPWPDALEALTGSRRMDATALLDYFAPLRQWLDEQNRGQPSGW